MKRRRSRPRSYPFSLARGFVLFSPRRVAEAPVLIAEDGGFFARFRHRAAIMGFSADAVARFREKVDDALAAVFPAALLLGVDRIPAVGSGPGGRAVTEYMEGGEAETFRFPFRVERPAMNGVPYVGMELVWVVAVGTEIPLEISELPFRPHESGWSFTCKKRRV